MQHKPHLFLICLIFVFLFVPSIAAGDVSVPWDTQSYHAHGDASYYSDCCGSDSDSDDAYSPPLPLPINASAFVDRGAQYGSGDSTMSDAVMTVTTFATDSAPPINHSTDGSASNDFIGTFHANTSLFQFSYSYNYDISVDCNVFPDPLYVANAQVSTWLKVTDLTDSIILFDGPYVAYASISCDAENNPGISSDSGSDSGVISVPVIIGHEIEVEFGMSGGSGATGCPTQGGTDFTVQYDTSMVTGQAPVPWYSEDYHTDGYAGYWSNGGSSYSDSCDSYSPPLQLPINCTASVSLPGCPYGPPWGNGMCQNADGYGAITNSEMVIDTSVYDILGDPWNPNYISDASASASDDFTGSFTATHELFEFSYSYDYSLSGYCCGLDPPEYFSYGGGSISGWLTVTDMTDSMILLDTTFLGMSVDCAPLDGLSDSGQGLLSVPVTVGHDIEVKFGINGSGSASGSYSLGAAGLTLQYDTAMRCIDPPILNPCTGEYYSSLQTAYDELITCDIIKVQALELTENLSIDRNISVTFDGGYDCNYSSIIGKTTVSGDVVILDGMNIMNNFILD